MIKMCMVAICGIVKKGKEIKNERLAKDIIELNNGSKIVIIAYRNINNDPIDCKWAKQGLDLVIGHDDYAFVIFGEKFIKERGWKNGK